MSESARMLFLGKKGDAQTRRALAFCRQRCAHVTAYLGQWGDEASEDLDWWTGEYLISYLSPWICPEHLLQRTVVAALNFHPAPPTYPGIGCVNFALYEGATTYGVTCHHMASTVDTGPIVAVKRFGIDPADTVETLLLRTYDEQLVLFYDIVGPLLRGEGLPKSAEHWTRPPFTRSQLDELSRVTPAMNKEELARRIRATTFGPWAPILELHGFQFALSEDAGR